MHGRLLAVVAFLCARSLCGIEAAATATATATATASSPHRRSERASFSTSWGEEDHHVIDDEEDELEKLRRVTLPSSSGSQAVSEWQQATRRDEGSSASSSSSAEHYSVVVIGAGWSGLGAARTLQTSHPNLLVLEGRDYVGGRSHTVRFRDGTPVELGSGWVHGASSDNVVYNVVQESGMGAIVSADEVKYWSNAYQDDLPHSVNVDDVEPLMENLTEGFQEFLDAYPDDDDTATDAPLVDAVTEFEQQEGMGGDDVELAFDLALDSNIVAEYAASLQDLSRWWWDEDAEPVEGGDAIIGNDGYSGAVNWYASPLRDNIRLEANVTAIDWSEPSVVSITYVQNGELHTVTADKVIVTVPLGVLKRGAIKFTPDLPQTKLDAIDRLGMGLLNKCIMKWSSNATLPWPSDLGWLERIAPLGEQGQWTEFYSLERDTQHKVLIAWSAGREADRVEALDDVEIKAEVVDALAAMFGEGVVPTPDEWIISRWRADPWSYGSYSYHAVGSGPDDRKALAKPVDDRLFFAGEATHLQYMSTTHGALASGITAGTMVREMLATSTGRASWTDVSAYLAIVSMVSTLWFLGS